MEAIHYRPQNETPLIRIALVTRNEHLLGWHAILRMHTQWATIAPFQNVHILVHRRLQGRCTQHEEARKMDASCSDVPIGSQMLPFNDSSDKNCTPPFLRSSYLCLKTFGKSPATIFFMFHAKTIQCRARLPILLLDWPSDIFTFHCAFC